MIEVEEFETEEILEKSEFEENKMPTFNHSYICNKLLRQLFENDVIEPFPELTLDIENGITPDISVYPNKNFQPNFLRDVIRFPEMPILAIEIISPSQNIQTLLEKAEMMVKKGVKTVWTIEPFTNTIIVTTSKGEKRFPNQIIESEGIKVDFRQIFGEN